MTVNPQAKNTWRAGVRCQLPGGGWGGGGGGNVEDDVTCIMLHQINKYKTIINQFMCINSALQYLEFELL